MMMKKEMVMQRREVEMKEGEERRRKTEVIE